MENYNLNINRLNRFPVGKALLMLVLFFGGGMLLSMVVVALLSLTGVCSTLTLMKWSVVVQNLVAFVLPAYLTARMLDRRPLQFLALTRCPSWQAVAGVIVIYVIMTPFMNWIVVWNESLTLPSWLAPLEQWLKAREMAAQSLTDQIVDVSSFPAMLLSVVYVGLLTGLSEEMFFRGAMQNIFVRAMRSSHVAVWTAAVVFSLLHFQFYGFVPRVLLGVFFGYACLWSGSLWPAIIGHALNNSSVVVCSYIENVSVGSGLWVSEIGAGSQGFPVLAVCSLLLTVVLMIAYHYMLQSKHNLCR